MRKMIKLSATLLGIALLGFTVLQAAHADTTVKISLTDKGAAFYQELESTWNEMANAVGQITKNGHETTTHESTSTI